MKRSLPKAVQELVKGGALGLVVFLGASACEPQTGVPAGAPVVTFSIAEPDGTTTFISGKAEECEADAGLIAEGANCEPNEKHTPVCALGGSFCHCVAKADDDATIDPENVQTLGTLVCTYSPASVLTATFDRLLDGRNLEPVDASGVPGLATLTAMPALATAPTITAEYISSGIMGGLFSAPAGPRLVFTIDPGLPEDSLVTFQLDGTKVRAKDGKTAATAAGLLAGGKLTFKTGTIPVPPPDGGDDDGGADGGVLGDGQVIDASASDGGLDLAADL